jgi:hypothetical protein
MTLAVEHFMGVDCRISFFHMTLKAAFPSVGIRPSPQEFRRSLAVRSAVNFMTGQTPHLAAEERPGKGGRIGGRKVYGVMVFTVIVAVETERRGLRPLLEGCVAPLRLLCGMAPYAKGMGILIPPGSLRDIRRSFGIDYAVHAARCEDYREQDRASHET